MTLLGCASVVAAFAGAHIAYAQEEEAAAPAAADENKVDEALQAEVRYVEALVDSGFPDFAEPVIEATKKKWPEADTLFFAIEIRGMLSLGKFDEAEKKVASLPDRNGAKYWAARLEIANNFFARGKKSECKAIYDEFFKKFSDPKKMPKELAEFYKNASYSWGQILVGDKRFDEATKVYEGLLKLINKEASDDDANTWCNVACETAEMYLHLATDKEKIPDRMKYLDPAKKLVDKLLWEQDKPVYFGRAIAMKANIELLKGDIAKAQATIDDYMDQLADLHKSIAEFDPDGKYGLLKQSPMPLCRYMLADMYWKEVQAEMKKPKRDDDRIKGLLFGEKLQNGRRNNAGAFNHALNVFARYPESTWAASAGELSETIREFAEKTYGAKIQTNITPEQMKRVRQMQFKAANEKLAENDFEGAIKDYLDALSRFPEGEESIPAIENVASAYLNLIIRSKDEAKKADWRIDADAVEGYISERFAGHKNRTIMNLGGDATLRLAALEKQYGNIARADVLYKAFLMNYRQHVNAAMTCAAMAGEAQRAEKWNDAASMWDIITKYYTNSVYYTTALANLAVCQDKGGDRKAAIETLKKYVSVEVTPLKKMQSQMQLAMMYQKDGLDMITAADSAENEEAAEKLIATGSAQIIRGIKQFQDFAAAAAEKLADAGVSAGEKKQYASLREGALYLAGDCWSRLKKPVAKLEAFRKKAAECFEAYVKAYPDGKYAKATYVKLGAAYAALGDAQGSKSALDRLAERFPDSDESKNAKPRLAKLLIDMGNKKEGTEIYAEMLKTDGAYTAGQFVAAGEALIDAKSWELADMAFDKAEQKAGTNQMSTVAKARIGKAKALFKQGPGSFVEARNQIDLFLQDEKMSRLAIAAEANLLLVEVASEQGRTEKNDQLRKKHFAAAVGAVKKLRTYWKNKPQHEQDQIDLMSADVTIRRMKAEDAMELKEQAQETCATAAAMLQTFLQTRSPNEEHPIDKMSAGELANLERCYATMVPLFSRLGDEQADRVLKFGNEYLEYFPNGKARTEIVNCVNRAKSAGAVVRTEEKPQENAASEPAESAETTGTAETAETTETTEEASQGE